ncbi:MAG: alpha/beta fold hydrolase [Thermoguttaceae bacterium]
MQVSSHALSTAARFARIIPLAATLAVAALVWLGPSGVTLCRAADNKKSDKDELPKPEDVLLRTDDGVQIAATYYRGTKGKETIPVVVLHGWKQNRSEMRELALALQAQGHAVVAPDLRGHGESTRRRGGKDERLDAAKMPPSQFSLMVYQDMKAVKDFLWERNNAGELNLDKLCIVGADMGASVALDFAAYDATAYDGPTLYYGPLKLGRFVKALVLISPKLTLPGLPLNQAARVPAVQRDIAMMIVVGKEDPKELPEAKRVHGLFKTYHIEPTGPNKTDEQTLFFIPLPTSLQGTKLLDQKFNLQAGIADFIDRRLVKSEESRDWTWKERKFPHQ